MKHNRLSHTLRNHSFRKW